MKAIYKIEDKRDTDDEDNQSEDGHALNVLHCYVLDDVRDVFAAIGGLLQFLDDFLLLDQGDGSILELKSLATKVRSIASASFSSRFTSMQSSSTGFLS